MKTIYIIGKMTGEKLFNFPAFDAAEVDLLKAGWDVISPAGMDRAIDNFHPEDFPDDYDWTVHPACMDYEKVMERDLDAVRRSDAVYLLEGWQHSKGGLRELHDAKKIGLEVYEQVDGVPLPPREVGICEEADSLINGDRAAAYGPWRENLAKACALSNQMTGENMKPLQGSWFMVGLKLGRHTFKPQRDNFVDAAGYLELTHRIENE